MDRYNVGIRLVTKSEDADLEGEAEDVVLSVRVRKTKTNRRCHERERKY